MEVWKTARNSAYIVPEGDGESSERRRLDIFDEYSTRQLSWYVCIYPIHGSVESNVNRIISYTLLTHSHTRHIRTHRTFERWTTELYNTAFSYNFFIVREYDSVLFSYKSWLSHTQSQRHRENPL